YLDIERARFEDRLRIHIDVPWELRDIRIPALVIQPIVENAIKHGVSACRAGGEIRIAVRLQALDGSDNLSSVVRISVTDTGVGVTEAALAQRRKRGLGLSNVEQRLQRYGAGTAPLRLQSTPGVGTTVEIQIPLGIRQMV